MLHQHLLGFCERDAWRRGVVVVLLFIKTGARWAGQAEGASSLVSICCTFMIELIRVLLERTNVELYESYVGNRAPYARVVVGRDFFSPPAEPANHGDGNSYAGLRPPCAQLND